MEVIETGTAASVTVSFAVTGIPTDPTTVTIKYKVGTGTPTVLVYGTGTEITRSRVGVYKCSVSTVGKPGTWVVEAIGTGTCAAVGSKTFTVKARPI